jgi:two-component system phosphate regulon sensor histidine kinase PhoR
MHTIDWKTECRSLALLLAVSALVGWYVGLLPWFLFVGTLGYVVWTLLQLRRMHLWLNQKENTSPPESIGFWGEVFDSIYRRQRQRDEENERLQAAVHYLQASFASLDDGAVMIDERGNIEWSNQAASELLGLRYPEDRRQQISNLIRSPEFSQYFEANDYTFPLQIVSSHNSLYHLQIMIKHFGEGSRLLFARDITETNRLQQMRTDFIANVSHELRTPLTVIKGYLETFAEYGFSDEKNSVGESRSKRMVAQMVAQSDRMEMLVKGLMVLARLESVPEVANLEPVMLFPMLSSIREEVLTAVTGERIIRIECDENSQIRGNSFELRSAFSNLVMNAAKYTQPGSEIVVRWQVGSRSAALEVEDNGEGIDSYHIPRLTERFYRVDKSRASETGGAGLGLAIVKHILLRHKAHLTVTSSLGEGSVFRCEFSLPVD